jgi:predicted nucleic acid-binding protein
VNPHTVETACPERRESVLVLEPAELALDGWNHKVKPKDAIHVATALDAGVGQFDTFDGDLIALSGQIGNPPLVIGRPNLPERLF